MLAGKALLPASCACQVGRHGTWLGRRGDVSKLATGPRRRTTGATVLREEGVESALATWEFLRGESPEPRGLGSRGLRTQALLCSTRVPPVLGRTAKGSHHRHQQPLDDADGHGVTEKPVARAARCILGPAHKTLGSGPLPCRTCGDLSSLSSVPVACHATGPGRLFEAAGRARTLLTSVRRRTSRLRTLPHEPLFWPCGRFVLPLPRRA